MNGATETLAQFVVGTRFEDIPAVVLQNAKLMRAPVIQDANYWRNG